MLFALAVDATLGVGDSEGMGEELGVAIALTLGVALSEGVGEALGVGLGVGDGDDETPHTVQLESANAPATALQVEPAGQGTIDVAFGQ